VCAKWLIARACVCDVTESRVISLIHMSYDHDESIRDVCFACTSGTK